MPVTVKLFAMAPINIRDNVLDPANPGDVHLPPNAIDTDHVLVQLREDMSPNTVTALHQAGATIVKRMVSDFPSTSLQFTIVKRHVALLGTDTKTQAPA